MLPFTLPFTLRITLRITLSAATLAGAIRTRAIRRRCARRGIYPTSAAEPGAVPSGRRRSGATVSITVITETFNHTEGQSWWRLVGALDAAVVAAEQFDDGLGDGPNRVLMIDASTDDRAEGLVARRRATACVPVHHLRVPAHTSYDRIKDLGASESTTPFVAYLDGDCIPAADPASWLHALFHTLVTTGAPGVCGTTVYAGNSPLRIACSAMDFGFALHRRGGTLGSYTSNNVMFRRGIRADEPADVDGLRCACYLHAQRFLRDGTPMRHCDSTDALVTHEFPPLWRERFRRGYDAVAVTWTDPTLFEARCFGGRRAIAATFGLARYVVGVTRLDAKVIIGSRRYRRTGPVATAAAIALLPVLRAFDALGIWRALVFGRDPRWDHEPVADPGNARVEVGGTTDG